MKPLWKVAHIVRENWVLVAKDRSNTECQSGSKQARVNGESKYDNVSRSLDSEKGANLTADSLQRLPQDN